jgi:mannose-6-phosphate isomerase-like protein (cupin superfamily)
MRLTRSNPDINKGWIVGPWDSKLEISIGYAKTCVDEPHLHEEVRKIYLIARGDAEIRVERQTIKLTEGHILIIEPGEAHTFLSSTRNYFHFVIRVPGLSSEEALRENTPVLKARWGI